MNNSSATSKGRYIWIGVIAVETILTIGILFAPIPENIRPNCLAAAGITVTITALVSGLTKHWISMCLCVLMVVGLVAAIVLYALQPSTVEPPPPLDDDPTISSPFPPDPVPPSDPDDTFTFTEIDPTKDSVDFVPIDSMEKNQSTDESNYLPVMEMQDYRHLFISFIEEFPDPEAFDIHECRTYILENVGEWSVEKLKSFIIQQFEESYQTVEDYPAHRARTNADVGEKIISINKLTEAITQARATNEPTLSLYQECAKLYLEIIDIAPRGEYYLQLARPYEEGILRMRRVEPSEKNAVFLWAANAVVYFRTALTYKASVGASVSDVFYRIAKIYHYIGDTPELHPDIRSYFYRVSAAYMTLAAEREASSDRYYGYSTYYGAMVYHKLAIITVEPDEKWDYLEYAEQSYEKADKDYDLGSKAKEEIKHALADIDTRKRQGH